MVNSHKEILYNNEHKQFKIIFSNMDESHKHEVAWKKTEINRQTTRFLLYKVQTQVKPIFIEVKRVVPFEVDGSWKRA